MDTEIVPKGYEINAKNKIKKLQGSNMHAVRIQELLNESDSISSLENRETDYAAEMEKDFD